MTFYRDDLIGRYAERGMCWSIAITYKRFWRKRFNVKITSIGNFIPINLLRSKYTNCSLTDIFDFIFMKKQHWYTTYQLRISHRDTSLLWKRMEAIKVTNSLSCIVTLPNGIYSAQMNSIWTHQCSNYSWEFLLRPIFLDYRTMDSL